jgi:inner membrane protein
VSYVYKTGHYGTALIAYAPVALFLTTTQQYVPLVLGWFIVVSLTRIPDWDMWLPIPHRGPTHTVWFALFMGVLTGAGLAGLLYGIGDLYVGFLGYKVNQYTLIGAALFGFSMGALSILAHLLGDIITPTGIKPFAFRGRLTKRYRFVIARAANELANNALFVLGFVLVCAAVFLGAYVSGTLPSIPTFDWPFPAPDIPLPRF